MISSSAYATAHYPLPIISSTAPPTKPASSLPQPLPPEPESPRFPALPSSPAVNLSAKNIDTTNTTYPLSHERTDVSDLPFPHPKYHTKPGSGEIYEVVSPIVEEYDPVSGFIGEVGDVRISVEGGDGYGEEGGKEKDKEGEKLKGQAVDRDREAFGRNMGEVGGEERVWKGWVEFEESGERSSISRERERGKEGRGKKAEGKERKGEKRKLSGDGAAEATEGEGVRRSKRLKGKHRGLGED